MKKLNVRPSRAMSAFQVVVALGMLVFGISMFGEHGAGGGMGGTFLIFWVLAVVGVGGYHLMNSLGKAPPVEVAELIDTNEGPPSVEARLRALDDLRDKGLVTPAEYDAKRRDILAGL